MFLVKGFLGPRVYKGLLRFYRDLRFYKASRSLSSTLLPFFWAPLLKPNSRKKGTLIIKRLLRNRGFIVLHNCVFDKGPIRISCRAL